MLAQAPFVFEKGRKGVWLHPDEDQSRLSPWHAVVIESWRKGEKRADYTTPASDE